MRVRVRVRDVGRGGVGARPAQAVLTLQLTGAAPWLWRPPCGTSTPASTTTGTDTATRHVQVQLRRLGWHRARAGWRWGSAKEGDAKGALARLAGGSGEGAPKRATAPRGRAAWQLGPRPALAGLDGRRVCPSVGASRGSVHIEWLPLLLLLLTLVVLVVWVPLAAGLRCRTLVTMPRQACRGARGHVRVTSIITAIGTVALCSGSNRDHLEPSEGPLRAARHVVRCRVGLHL